MAKEIKTIDWELFTKNSFNQTIYTCPVGKIAKINIIYANIYAVSSNNETVSLYIGIHEYEQGGGQAPYIKCLRSNINEYNVIITKGDLYEQLTEDVSLIDPVILEGQEISVSKTLSDDYSRSKFKAYIIEEDIGIQ